MSIQQLDPQFVTAYKAIRLEALRECPAVFNSSYEEEKKRPLSDFVDSLVPSSNRITFGAFDTTQLIAIVSVTRDKRKKVNHKGNINGMYVSANYRGRGFGRQLLAYALEFADLKAKLVQMTLVVNATNTSAISLYESFGFKTFGIEPLAAIIDGVPQDQMHMVRLKPFAFSNMGLQSRIETRSHL